LAGYHFLNSQDSGYTHFTHNHRGGDFWIGIQSTSHIEFIWSILKHKIKSTYNIIPSKRIIHFLREAEYKSKIRNKSIDEKLINFFECWELLDDTKDFTVVDDDFLVIQI